MCDYLVTFVSNSYQLARRLFVFPHKLKMSKGLAVPTQKHSFERFRLSRAMACLYLLRVEGAFNFVGFKERVAELKRDGVHGA